MVLDPLNGVTARCKFLPTFADISAVLIDYRNKQDQFKPAHTQYRKLEPESGPWDGETDYERKARVVKELLGYNPSPKAQQTEAPRVFTEPTAEDLRNLRLKTPPAPITRELLALFEAEGWPFIPSQQEQAA